MYQSFEPTQVLSPFVECYWSWSIGPDQQTIDDILPDAAPEFILHLAAMPFVKSESGEWIQQHRAFLYCAAHRTLNLAIREPMMVFAIRFRPWGVSRFSQQSMANMLDRPVLPSEVFGKPGDELVAGLRACHTDADRIQLVNSLLGDALRIPARNEARLKKLLYATDGGRCKSAEMSRLLEMSNRSFSRLWNEIVGIQPRRFVQLMRFHNALAMIESGEKLADVAAECGFSDQAHMARRIKAISGLPPSSLRRRLGNSVYQDLYASRPGAPWHGREKQ